LIPELRNLDYFLLVQDQTQQLSIATFMDHLGKNPLIQSVVKLDVSKIKSKDNLLTY
jgi:hypothetical protein